MRVAARWTRASSVTWRFPAAALGLTLLAGLFAVKASSKMPDFEVYVRAGARAAAAESLYRVEDQHYQLKYLPAFAILAIPATALPLPLAKALWFALSAGLLCALLALSLTLIPEPRKRGWVLVGVTLAAMAKFYGHELVLGQVNLLLAVVALLAVHASCRGQSIAAGLLVALAVVVKPYAVIFLPWLAVRRDVGALAAAALGLAAALALPVVPYGIDGTLALHRDWWRTVSESTAPSLLNVDNVSLAAMYAKWLGPGPTAAWLTVATAVVLIAAVAILLLQRRRVARPEGLEAAVLLTLIPLLSPQGWDYVFLLSTPAVMFLVNYERELPQPLRIAALAALAAIALSLYDVMGRQAYQAFMLLSIISVCYLIVFAALLALRVRQVA